MTELDKIAEAAKQEAQALCRYRAIGAMNQPADAAERQTAAAEYRVAEAEYLRISFVRERMQQQYAAGIPLEDTTRRADGAQKGE